MIDWPAIIARADESERFIIEVGAELLQRLAICSPRKRDISDAMDTIENKAARSLQIKSPIFVRRIIEHRAHLVALAQLVDQIVASFSPAQGRIHRIKRDPSIVMRREPIVRENGVRFGRRGRVIENMNCYSRIPQCLDGMIELILCARRKVIASIGID